MPTLEWIGKKAVVKHHREVPFHLLKRNDSLSAGAQDSGNLLVQGDNLLALKALLPYYAGQVKCIYIDPPYNTGNENWVYNDNVNSSEIREWLGRVVGREGEDLSRHDKWLCMIYPRLNLLREFLRDDGLIFISIDENEHQYLRLVVEEIFGNANHIETIIWKKSYGGGAKSKHIVNLHEYIICFAKNIDRVEPFELPPNQEFLKYYKLTDEKITTRGPYRLQPLATTSMDARPNLRYPIPFDGEEIWPEKQWQWSKERVLKALNDNELVFMKKGSRWTVSYKQYLKDADGEERKQKPYSIIEGVYTQQGTNEIKGIFGDGKAFSFPKPTKLIKHLIQMCTNDNDVILDSFAGSGTTGNAVLDLNKEDGGTRRFILVEMDERICREITAERLRHVVNDHEINESNGKHEKVDNTRNGFQYCELGETLFDAKGQLREEVSFDDLARHVFFIETGEPLPNHSRGESPLIGVANDIAIYLLFNGVLRDKSVQSGNVLTNSLLGQLPQHHGPKIIYGTSCRIGQERLRSEGIMFRQIPYEVRIA